MDNNIINTLNPGEKVVEMQECTLHGQTVIKVTVYTCHINVEYKGFLKTKKIEHKEIDKYEFPFYFSSKKFAEEFLQSYDKYKIEKSTYWNHTNIGCYTLTLSNYKTHLTYHMVDDFKFIRKDNFDNKCHLQERGVWGGIVNTDGHFSTYGYKNINYKEIYKYENIAIENGKKYVFKMIEQ